MFARSKLTRRKLLRIAAPTVIAALCSPSLIRSSSGGQEKQPSSDPFKLGVASGSPAPDGFVLWTRLAPEPLSTDPETPGGMRGGSLEIAYEIATDAEMRDIVRQGTTTADSDLGFSVHLEVSGLQPARPYWYRFRTGDAVSRIGRAVTAPAPGDSVDALRFGFVSCSNYEAGYFSAYRHLADQHPDIVLFAQHRPHPQRRQSRDDTSGLSQPLCAIPPRSRFAAAACRGPRSGLLGRSRSAK